ncbi:DNA polymerase IV [Salicibibacter cibarius]|uniref:DNA polymerase IV n=1 Tax=Salicibibacter cibarius TaxID=2743000 RepID=A0A7T6Z7E4_9BACI|nr:DNA polymerase IV [Salicibibacter cibarius]QQK78360.1 DNA polymerase IV [Salicibibacter cibarius]
MDAFFSSVEERDNPSLKGKPVIIAKHPKKTGGKGIVSTANYEARKYGVHSAMSAYKAYEQCPHGIFIDGNYRAYREASLQIREIMQRYTPMVEPVSIDEAYMDVTTNNKKIPSATILAKQIQNDIWQETKLTSSAGVSYNKFIAKIASDMKKPAGLTVVPPDEALPFLKQLPIEKFPGIGPKTAQKMHDLNIYTGEDLYQMEQMDLISLFGKAGTSYYHRARGIDNKPLNMQRERKSVGKERTYFHNLTTDSEVTDELRKIAQEVVTALNRVQKHGKTVVLKIRYRSFETLTRQVSAPHYFETPEAINDQAAGIWEEVGMAEKGVRLLGITITNLDPIHYRPMTLF